MYPERNKKVEFGNEAENTANARREAQIRKRQGKYASFWGFQSHGPFVCLFAYTIQLRFSLTRTGVMRRTLSI